MSYQAISDVQQRNDGHIYYVIGKEGGGDFIARCKTIGERNSLTGKGICFVEQAYKDDPTVMRGWALYMSIGTETTTTSIKWVKIAEEESVDGIWGIQNEVLRTLVQKSVFNAAMQENENEHSIFRAAAKKINSIDFHSHLNKSVLDSLSDHYGQLYYKNLPIGGGTYLYDELASGNKLVWRNPLTPDVAEEVDNSEEIATRFCSTTMSYVGQTLLVVEPDGSISSYIIWSKNSTKTPVYVGTIGGNLSDSKKTVQFVEGLPQASSLYEGKGYWYLLPPAICGNKSGRVYECVKDNDTYYWKDILSDVTQVSIQGAKFTSCYKVKWNKISMTFTTPENQEVDGTNVNWSKTYVVRKIGSAPVDKNDGVVIKEVTERDKFVDEPLIDVTPLTHEKIYYGLFSETNSDAPYTVPEFGVMEARYPDWDYITDMLKNGSIEKMLSIGDEIVLPEHETFGSMVGVVLGFENGNIRLFIKDSIAELPLDGKEYALEPAPGGSMYLPSKSYATLTPGLPPGVSALQVGTPEYPLRMTPLVSGEDYTPNDPTDLIPEDSGIFIAGDVNQTAEIITGSDGKYYFYYHGNALASNSNLVQWLNSNKRECSGEEGWFESKSKFDTLDDSFNIPGFLAGFNGSEEDGSDPFYSLIRSVALPTESDITASQDISDLITTDTWIDKYDTGHPSRAYVISRSTKTAIDVLPEEKKSVNPVIVLGIKSED